MRWQKILAQGFGHVDELLTYLDLPLEFGSHLAQRQFKTRVPRGFAERMQRQNPNCPLLLQVLASQQELESPSAYVTDPLDEQRYNPLPGLIHKYKNRVLLTLTGTCAVNCRYCFRRHFSYDDNNPGRAGWGDVVRYILEHPEIDEVILSGGDPLMASDVAIEGLLSQLSDCSSLKTLRIHSRIPVVLPERIDDGFLDLLNHTPLNKVLVIHANHPCEFDDSVFQALHALKQQGVHLLNQSVLLKGINDHGETLCQLSHQLFAAGVLPYYLHMLDPVAGAHHFDISLKQAQDLHQYMQQNLSGYLVPKLVREQPGALHKICL